MVIHRPAGGILPAFHHLGGCLLSAIAGGNFLPFQWQRRGQNRCPGGFCGDYTYPTGVLYAHGACCHENRHAGRALHAAGRNTPEATAPYHGKHAGTASNHPVLCNAPDFPLQCLSNRNYTAVDYRLNCSGGGWYCSGCFIHTHHTPLPPA